MLRALGFWNIWMLLLIPTVSFADSSLPHSIEGYGAVVRQNDKLSSALGASYEYRLFLFEEIPFFFGPELGAFTYKNYEGDVVVPRATLQVGWDEGFIYSLFAGVQKDIPFLGASIRDFFSSDVDHALGYSIRFRGVKYETQAIELDLGLSYSF